ncbi:putative disease resistance protein RGA3 [Sesamum angolense]|uniref:Disease resistance protein RGA3 n=1 Tax=Sesamum angolense TaxID=2727404 RepID=A0AAE2BK96_9LAMI|nr:putative disease resistance protein RGA3 [Sesamum angolense]
MLDAERRRYKDKTVQNWLKKLEDVSYDVDDVLDEWNFGALKLHIQRKNKHKPMDRRESGRVQSVSLVDVLDIHGRGDDREALVSKLMHEALGPLVVSIVGVGGIGKTTLAQLVYNDERLVNCFELKIWVCVSDVFDEVRIAKAILESVKKESSDLKELESLLKCLKDCVSGKKFLLVLDDVWTEDYTKWEPLKTLLVLVPLEVKFW